MQKDTVIFEANHDRRSTVEDFLLREWFESAYSDEDIINLQETVYAPAVVAQKICDPEHPSKAWIALHEGKAAGRISTNDVSGGVIVKEEFRGQGIGAALTEERNNYLRSIGENQTTVQVEVNNAASLAMHMKLGYEFTQASSDLIALNAQSGTAIHDIRDISGHPAIIEMTKPL